MERYARNKILTSEAQAQLAQKRVAIIGVGGLGGYILEMLVRLGVGQFVLVDGDVFEESNLNRQLLCLTNTLGQSKVQAAAERAKAIDPRVELTVHEGMLDKHNATSLLEGCDLVMDGLDNNQVRLSLVKAAQAQQIPYIYGAIAGWNGQVGTIFPEDDSLPAFLEGLSAKGVEEKVGNPSFTPAAIASFQVAEAVKVLSGEKPSLRNCLLYIDLYTMEVFPIVL